jgi:hypothetical protein
VVVEKGPDVLAELLGVLVEEAVAGVRVDAQPSVGQVMGEQPPGD